MRAPNSISFLSKAYNFLKGKTSAHDENFYAKSKNSFPNEVYPILSESIVHNGFPSNSRKKKPVLGDISNRPWPVSNERERKTQRTNQEGLTRSPRARVKNYWTSKGEKKVNNDVQEASNNKLFYDHREDDEEEGTFTIQVCL